MAAEGASRRIAISLTSSGKSSGQRTKFDGKHGTPIITPLDTLEQFSYHSIAQRYGTNLPLKEKHLQAIQVLSWEAGLDELCVASVPLRPVVGVANPRDDASTQKMIICHDMMGGYIKDSFTQGIGDLEDYFFYHWQHIEAFIYFSHHFITIPPPSWTNAAHRHGVLSMATLITESEGGARLCHELFQDDLKVMEFAHQLVNLAKYYRFDGWLINIENPIHPMLLDRLYMFLTQLTTGMHSSSPGSKVIWYDSVTVQGKLKWQNKLNHMNRSFFDQCDGIFLNYNWTEQGLAQSRELAGERKGEIYVGIDVFGRGCPGGGKYNSCEALKSIHTSGLSSALFAPGWVFENEDKQTFFQNQNKFWSLLQPWLPINPLSALPLVSSFGRGCGRLLAIDGQVVLEHDWTNHSAQDLQPSFSTEKSILNDVQSAVVLERASVDFSTAYNNGASLKVEGRVRASSKQASLAKPSLLRLFKTNLDLSYCLVISYTYKATPYSDPTLMVHGCRYFLQLHTDGSPSRVFLDPFSMVAQGNDNRGEEENGSGGGALLSTCGLPRSRSVPGLPGCILAPIPPPHSGQLHRFYTGSSEQPDDWKTCYFVVDHEELRGFIVQELSIGFYLVGNAPSPPPNETSFSLTIGEIKVLDGQSFSPKLQPSTITSIQCHDVRLSYDRHKVSLTLSWLAMDSPRDPIDHVNIYSSCIISDKSMSTRSDSEDRQQGTDKKKSPLWKSSYKFWGRSYTNCYRVADFYLLGEDKCGNLSIGVGSSGAGSCGSGGGGQVTRYEFRLQPVSMSRSKPALGDSPSVMAVL